jgi:hypothetical protein
VLVLPNLLKDRLLHAVLCRISILILFLPKPPNRETTKPPHPSKRPAFPLLPFAALPNSRVDSSFDDSDSAAFRHPEHSPPPVSAIVCLTSLTWSAWSLPGAICPTDLA